MLLRRLLAPRLLAGLTAGLCLLLTLTIATLLQQDYRRQRQFALQEQLSAVRARLESQINAAMFLIRGLELEVSLRGDISQSDFEVFARELTQRNPLIRNIGLAPDNVIRYVYPLAGNEKALGVRYLDDLPDQRDGVLLAMRTGKPLLIGPVTLIQGGVGVIHRAPIYTRRGDAPRYWGLASVVIDSAQLLASAGVGDSNALRMAMRGRDGKGEQGEVFAGEAAVFAAPDASVPVRLPAGSWQLAAQWRQGGWSAMALLVLVLGTAGSASVGVLAWQAASQSRRAREMSLHDPLTGLPNRRLLDLRLDHALGRSLRDRLPLAVLCLDLDNFKPINDRHGHEAGDVVLREAGERMRAQLRSHDTLARVGGDEFLLLLEPLDDRRAAAQVAAKLIEALAAPFHWQGETLHIGVSIGIAISPDAGNSKHELIRHADQAMYQAKFGGKNHFAFWEPPAD